jgi:hypothetical protein
MVVLTFMVADPPTHCMVTENVEREKQAYPVRTGHTLDAVREALRAIGN